MEPGDPGRPGAVLRFGREIALNWLVIAYQASRKRQDGPKEGAGRLKPLVRFAVYMDADKPL
jgi:hypothetical protein